MAIPANHSSIETNLPAFQLEKVLSALENGKTKEIDGTHSLFAEARSWQVTFEGAIYVIDEFVERVVSVHLVSGDQKFFRSLLRSFERSLQKAVKERSFAEAQTIDKKIKQLEALRSKEEVSHV